MVVSGQPAILSYHKRKIICSEMRALRDARSTITNLTEKLHTAQRALATVERKLAAERQQAIGAARKAVAAPAANVLAIGDEVPQIVRRPRGRPRKLTVLATVEKTVTAARAIDAPANGDQPAQTVRGPGGRPKKHVTATTAEKPVRAARKGSGRSVAGDREAGRKTVTKREKASRPIRWWLVSGRVVLGAQRQDFDPTGSIVPRPAA